MTHIKRIDEIVKYHKINESYDMDNYRDYFLVLIGMYPQDLDKIQKLCDDLDYEGETFDNALSSMDINDAETISKVYYQSIFDTYVRDLVEKHKVTDEESENIIISFSPVEFYYENEEFNTTKELMRIIKRKRVESKK